MLNDFIDFGLKDTHADSQFSLFGIEGEAIHCAVS
jgi:hypothetical protein